MRYVDWKNCVQVDIHLRCGRSTTTVMPNWKAQTPTPATLSCGDNGMEYIGKFATLDEVFAKIDELRQPGLVFDVDRERDDEGKLFYFVTAWWMV